MAKSGREASGRRQVFAVRGCDAIIIVENGLVMRSPVVGAVGRPTATI